MQLPIPLLEITSLLIVHRLEPIVVGGAVRDHFLNKPSKDYDIEVHGISSLEALGEYLKVFGTVSEVGKQFGVLKLDVHGYSFDFSLPRSETKVDVGHKGFEVDTSDSLTFSEASKRRDFTMNAMGYDVFSDEFLDPFDGLEDIEQGILRHIDDASFMEDPLRVYRAVQFCARFGLSLHEDTVTLCKTMVAQGLLEELPQERVYEEFKKLLLKSPKPSLGFELMRELGVLRYFPELEALIGVRQSAKWHPEGDVWVHTLLSLDAMVALLGSDERENLIYLFAMLCHDLGKPATTSYDEQKQDYTALGHEKEGLATTQSFLTRLTSEQSLIDEVLPLVAHHLKPSQFFRDGAKDGAIRRLATKVNIEKLVKVARADFLGRTTKEALSGEYKAGDWLLERAKALEVSQRPLDNLLQGRDLIALGFEPSQKFKEILDDVYERYLEEELTNKEDAIVYVKNRY